MGSAPRPRAERRWACYRWGRGMTAQPRAAAEAAIIVPSRGGGHDSVAPPPAGATATLRSLPPAHLLQVLQREVRRIVVVRALYLGDLLVAIPAFRALWHAFPAAEISYVGLPWAQGLISRYGYVDRFLEFPGYPGIPEVEVVTERTAAFFEAAATYGY